MKKGLIALGYMTGLSIGQDPNKVSKKMPNTTLWHKSKTPAQCLEDMKAVAKNIGATLDKAIALEFTNKFVML